MKEATRECSKTGSHVSVKESKGKYHVTGRLNGMLVSSRFDDSDTAKSFFDHVSSVFK